MYEMLVDSRELNSLQQSVIISNNSSKLRAKPNPHLKRRERVNRFNGSFFVRLPGLENKIPGSFFGRLPGISSFPYFLISKY